MEGSIAGLRETFKSGRTRSVAWRKNQLKAVIDLINENEQTIYKVLHQDLGKDPAESYRDEVSAYVYMDLSANFVQSKLRLIANFHCRWELY